MASMSRLGRAASFKRPRLAKFMIDQPIPIIIIPSVTGMIRNTPITPRHNRTHPNNNASRVGKNLGPQAAKDQ